MRLTRSDLAGALDFLRAAGELAGPDPFPREVPLLLAALVRCQRVSYAERDRVRGETTFAVSTDDEGPGAGAEAIGWASVHEHPVGRHRARTGSYDAFRIYDFVTAKELRATQFYAGYLRHTAAARGFQMTLALSAPPGTTRTFVLDRESVDFGERERALLNLLRPHLLNLRRASDARRRAQSAIREVSGGGLTRRETEVLGLAAQGLRNRDIAAALWIAPGTVRKHLDNIYRKLGVENRVAAAATLAPQTREVTPADSSPPPQASYEYM